MFQRNGRSGYVLKPPAIRLSQKKDLLTKRTLHLFNHLNSFLDWPVVVVGDENDKGKMKAQEKTTGDDGADDQVVDDDDDTTTRPPAVALLLPLPPPVGASSTPARSISPRTSVVKKNGSTLFGRRIIVSCLIVLKI